MIAIFFATSLQAQIYVNHAATGANDGSSWTDAYTDLSDALSNSVPNDEIWVAAGTYKPGGATPSVDTFFTFPHDLSLYGGFAGTEANLSERDWTANETILSGDHNDDDIDDDFTTNKIDNSLHVMWLTDTVTAASTIDGFTVRNGITEDGTGIGNDRRAGGILTYGNPSVRNCIFTQNFGHFGGGLYPRGPRPIIIEDCDFINNTASWGGTGIYILSDSAIITNCDFIGNHALTASGGAVYSSGVALDISNCNFDGNSAVEGIGGGLRVRNATTNAEVGLSVTDCTFTSNMAVDAGGLAISEALDATISNCNFNGNLASDDGGGFRSSAFTTNITNCTFSENVANDNGGALYFFSDSIVVNISDSEITNNSTMGLGGAISMLGANAAFLGNPIPVLNLENVFIISNIGMQQGGGVNMSNGNLNVINTLFDSNFSTNADGIGGAMSLNASDTIVANYSFMNTTIVNNGATLGAGIANWQAGTEGSSNATFQNTIIQNDGTNYEIEAGTPIATSNGGNLSSDDTMVGFLSGTNDLNDTDALFVDFDNEDYRLQNTSPCVDKGIATGAPLFDIEGMPRVDDIDMGAFENQKEVSVLNLHPTFGALEIYPNPVVENSLNFTFETAWRGEIQIQITDMDGKNIITQTVEKNDRKLVDVVDVKKLPQGMYNLTISNGRLVNTQSFMK